MRRSGEPLVGNRRVSELKVSGMWANEFRGFCCLQGVKGERPVGNSGRCRVLPAQKGVAAHDR